jgi:hypothetical protein
MCPIDQLRSQVLRGRYDRHKPRDKTHDLNIAPGIRIIADNKSTANATSMNAEIAKMTMKFKITLLRPIPFS